MLAIPVFSWHHLLNPAGAVALHGVFGEVRAVTTGIKRRAHQVWQAIHQVPGDLLLLFERHVAQLQHERHAANRVLLLQQGIVHRQVTAAAKVATQKERASAGSASSNGFRCVKPLLRLAPADVIGLQLVTLRAGQAQHRRASRHTGLNQGRDSQDTVKLLRCTGTVEFVYRCHPRLLGRFRPFFPGTQADTVEQSIRHGLGK